MNGIEIRETGIAFNLFRDLYFGILSVVDAEVADNRKRGGGGGGGTFVRISASTIIGKLSAPVYMCMCVREKERERVTFR